MSNRLLNALGDGSPSRRLSQRSLYAVTGGSSRRLSQRSLYAAAGGSSRRTSQRSLGVSNNYVLSNDDNIHDLTKQPTSEQFEDEHILPSVPEEELSKIQAFCGRFVNNSDFQKFIFVCIMLNSVLMAVATFDFISHDPDAEHVCALLDRGFLTIFTVELILHLGHYGVRFFRDGWLVFDLIIVTLSWAFEAFAILRAFRIMRTFRLITKMPQMRDLVNALLSVMPRMFAIFLLLLMIYFVFGVMFTEMFKTTYMEGYTSEDHFSRLDKTAFTLLQFMLLDNWSTITKELMQKYSWAWIPILTFIVISTFIVVNLIIAVICDAVAAIHSDEMTKQVEEMHYHTSDAMEQNHKEEMELLQTKMEEMAKLLASLQPARRQRMMSPDHSSTLTDTPSQDEQQPKRGESQLM